MTEVSLSQVGLWRNCEQAYTYRYMEGLEPKAAVVPLERGKIVHEYLSGYYQRLMDGGAGAEEAHQAAFAAIEATWREKLVALAETAEWVGASEAADELLGLWAEVVDLVEGYWVVHGREDAERWKVLAVEVPLRVRLFGSVTSLGVADLVVRDEGTGIVYLTEHKTAKTIPSTRYRLRDAQTLLYNEELRVVKGITAEGHLWNYVRTEPPSVPHINKDGKVSKAKIVTTWAVYARAVAEAGGGLEDYADVREYLEGLWEEQYYPRYSYLLLGNRNLLIRDYVASARAIERAREAHAAGKWTPVRNLTFMCDRCPFGKLCDGELVAGGTDQIRAMHYTTREARAQARAEVGEEEEVEP